MSACRLCGADREAGDCGLFCPACESEESAGYLVQHIAMGAAFDAGVRLADAEDCLDSAETKASLYRAALESIRDHSSSADSRKTAKFALNLGRAL